MPENEKLNPLWVILPDTRSKVLNFGKSSSDEMCLNLINGHCLLPSIRNCISLKDDKQLLFT